MLFHASHIAPEITRYISRAVLVDARKLGLFSPIQDNCKIICREKKRKIY